MLDSESKLIILNSEYTSVYYILIDLCVYYIYLVYSPIVLPIDQHD